MNDGVTMLKGGESDGVAFGDSSSDFRRLREHNTTLVYRELIPELSRICLSLGGQELGGTRRADVAGGDFEVLRRYPVLLAPRETQEVADADENGNQEGCSGVRGGEDAEGVIVETVVAPGAPDVEKGRGSLQGTGGAESTSEPSAPSGGLDEWVEDQLTKAAKAERARARKRAEAVLEKKVQEITNFLADEKSGERRNASISQASRAVGTPSAVREVRFKSDSSLSLSSEQLKFIRGLRSMRHSKLSNARRKLSPLRERSKDVGKELASNREQMLLGEAANAIRRRGDNARVRPALEGQGRRWLPGDTHGDSKNKFADYHSTIGGGRYMVPEKTGVVWEGSKFKVALLQELDMKLRLKVHFLAWKAANDAKVTLNLMIQARINKINTAIKHAALKELKKLLAQLGARTEAAVKSIEEFVRRRSLRLWLRYAKRELDLREKLEQCSRKRKTDGLRGILWAWRKYRDKEVFLRRTYSTLCSRHKAAVQRSVLRYWIVRVQRKIELQRKFLQLSQVHEERMKRSVMLYWKFRVLRRRIKDVNVGLATSFNRMRTVHLVIFGWLGVVSKMRNLRRALYSDIGRAGTALRDERGVYGAQAKKKYRKVLSEMKKARSVLMPKVKLLQDIQPTLWESALSDAREDLERSTPSHLSEIILPTEPLPEAPPPDTVSDEEFTHPFEERYGPHSSLKDVGTATEDFPEASEKCSAELVAKEFKPSGLVEETVLTTQSCSVPAKAPPSGGRTIEDIRTQYVAAMTGMFPRRNYRAKLETSALSTSSLETQKRVHATKQAIEEKTETEDAGTNTSHLAVVSSGTSPVRGPAMVDATIEAIEEKTETEDAGTTTSHLAVVSSGTSPVRGPALVDATIQVMEKKAKTENAATSMEIMTPVKHTVGQAAPLESSSSGKALEKNAEKAFTAEKAVHEPHCVVQDGEMGVGEQSNIDENDSKQMTPAPSDQVAVTKVETFVNEFPIAIPSTEVIHSGGLSPGHASRMAIKSVKELADDFYHRIVYRRVIRAVKMEIARSKQVSCLADESYKWHVFRYYLNIWFHNIVIVGRIAEERGNRTVLSLHLRTWQRFAAAQKDLKGRSDEVAKLQDFGIALAAFKFMKESYKESVLLKGQLEKFRGMRHRRLCQKTMHVWRLWSNLHITRRVAVLRVNYMIKLRVKRRCLMAWWQVQQSNKLLRKVLTQTRQLYGCVSNVENTLGKTFSLLMRILYAWRRVVFLTRGEPPRSQNPALVLQKSLGDLVRSTPGASEDVKEKQKTGNAMSKDTCHKMFLLWYLLAKNLSKDSRRRRAKLKRMTAFRTEFQYRRHRIASNHMNLWGKVIAAKRTLVQLHFATMLCRRSVTAWHLAIVAARKKELARIVRKLRFIFNRWKRQVLASAKMRWRLTAGEAFEEAVERKQTAAVDLQSKESNDSWLDRRSLVQTTEFQDIPTYVRNFSSDGIASDTVGQLEELRCQWKLQRMLKVEVRSKFL